MIWLNGLIEPAVRLPWSANQSFPSEAAVIPSIRASLSRPVLNSVTVGVAAAAEPAKAKRPVKAVTTTSGEAGSAPRHYFFFFFLHFFFLAAEAECFFPFFLHFFLPVWPGVVPAPLPLPVPYPWQYRCPSGPR